ncbi:50S ribosomal protein L23 [Buchnera aphidicola]|uniref:50S ribosomal protein L23 n=1 Tax=Buchnera aphidicola TaxID=9 RepID=UPI0034649F9A
MISEFQLFQILYSPYVSEKSTIFKKKNNVVIFKVSIKATKKEIKSAVEKLFSVNVNSINTVLIKGKCKKKGKYDIRRSNWKKAYVKISKDQNIDFINDIH